MQTHNYKATVSSERHRDVSLATNHSTLVAKKLAIRPDPEFLVGIYAVTDKGLFTMIFFCRRFAVYKCFYNTDQHGLTATGGYWRVRRESEDLCWFFCLVEIQGNHIVSQAWQSMVQANLEATGRF